MEGGYKSYDNNIPSSATLALAYTMIIPYLYSLSGNEIGDEGASLVCDAVNMNSSLQHLE